MADRNTPMKDGELISVPVAANAVINAGHIVVANASGYAAPGSVATTLTYLGRADESVDNTGGANGATEILVRRKKAFKFANSGTDAVSQSAVGKTCYIENSTTVSATNGTNSRSAAGTVLQIDSDGVWVE